MIAVTGGIFVAGCLWAATMVFALMPSRHSEAPMRMAARDIPQINLYVTQNGESKPPTAFQMPQPVQPTMQQVQPYQPHDLPAQWEPQPRRSPRFLQVQLPVANGLDI